jgi:ribosome biogenesis GTPase
LFVDLLPLGWNARLEAAFVSLVPDANLRPARVMAEHRGGWEVALAKGRPTCHAVVSGRLREEATTRAALPVVGDWVVVRAPPVATPVSQVLVESVLPRHTLLSRKEAGRSSERQLLAANVDHALLVTAPDGDFSPRRIERYLAVAWDGGARPVIVLGKMDLVADLDPFCVALVAIAPGVDVIAVSAHDGRGLDELRARLAPGETAALLGSSGVGKSTLVNALAGAALQATGAVRAQDAKGRHTTTGRRLVVLPGGGLVVDTPGMREVGLAGGDAGLAGAFADVVALAEHCRFRDCAHGEEPGCAVRAAVTDGRFDGTRLDAFFALAAEQARELARRDGRAARAEKARHKQLSRASRARARRDPKLR